MLDLLVATSNRGKLKEFQSLLPPWVRVVGLQGVHCEMPEETGATFSENAQIKAMSAASQTGMLCCADDSGICVEALGGAPGIYSARYAGVGASDAENRSSLLRALTHVPPSERRARFVCAIVLADPSGVIGEVEGVCQGSVALAERGDNGFGYDPLFQLADGRTIAMLSAAEKDVTSHRGQAVRMLIPLLEAQRRDSAPVPGRAGS